MMNSVLIKSYPAPEIDFGEILRYAGCKESDAAIDALLKECVSVARDKIAYRVCYAVIPVSCNSDIVDLGFSSVKSKDFAFYIRDCRSVVIFAATAGLELDRMIAANSITAPSKAVLLQAFGTERCESLCNVFCDDLRSMYAECKPRISPGYGDIPLDFQKDIFRLLSPEKIGITLNNSLLMSPSKSVTAIVGIKSGS